MESEYFDIFFYLVGPHGRRLIVADSIIVEQNDGDGTEATIVVGRV